MMLVVAITLDAIWSVRNKLVHEGNCQDIMEVIRSIRRRYEAHKEAWEQSVEVSLVTWKPPMDGELKINFDVAVHFPTLCAAAVCRNSCGNVLTIRICRRNGTVH